MGSKLKHPDDEFTLKNSSNPTQVSSFKKREIKSSSEKSNPYLQALEAQLNMREGLGSTGFGDGVAIPHGRIESLEKPFGVFVRLATPVDYDSVDDLPVDCVFALFSPEADGASHLRVLARISRRLRDSDFVAKLRGARSTDAVYALLANFEAADAA